ncbi:hypothetical protein Tco_1021713 [Tanacetum coccineum]
MKSQLADYDILYDKVPIFCDNTSVIAILNNPLVHSRTTHIEISDFSTITGLKYSENYDSLPLKENMRTGFSALRLVDEKNHDLSSTDLVNLSSLRIRYFLPIWSVLMLHAIKCLGEVALTSHMIKVANISFEPEQTLILPFKEVNHDETADKRYKTKETIADTQHAKDLVATADATMILEASESAEELRNQPNTTDATKNKSESTCPYLISSVHSESTPGNDTLRYKKQSLRRLWRFPLLLTLGLSHWEIDGKEADFDQEISLADENFADNILDELINEANKEDTNVFAALPNAVSSLSVPQTASASYPTDIQALIAKAV